MQLGKAAVLDAGGEEAGPALLVGLLFICIFTVLFSNPMATKDANIWN